ncbi:hypothetical protein [Ornithinimicrobium kibberense]|uniref:hypothetical protein n=1 Tax=Ornithinimicrobium kibberense TaxID=282060 RepID=UPI003614F046
MGWETRKLSGLQRWISGRWLHTESLRSRSRARPRTTDPRLVRHFASRTRVANLRGEGDSSA